MTTARHWIAPGFVGIDGLELVEFEVAPPGPGEVTIAVRSVGVGPADWKYISPEFAHASPKSVFPATIGSEVSGVITAIGPDTEIATGGGAVGDEVVAYRIPDGLATAVTVRASDVFAKPAGLSFAQAGGVLAVGVTALDMIRVAGLSGDSGGRTALVHGASGSVGVLLLQLLCDLGVRVVGTASAANRGLVERFGATWIPYGDGLVDRVRAAAPGGVDVAFDCVGTDEAIDVSVELLAESGAGTAGFVTIANSKRARAEGLTFIAGSIPEHAAYRATVRADVLAKAGAGELVLPLGPSFAFADAQDALRLLKGGHPGGKVTLTV